MRENGRYNRQQRQLGNLIFAITSKKEATLPKKVTSKIIIPEEGKPNVPRRVYIRAAQVLSPLPVKLARRLANPDSTHQNISSVGITR